MKCICFIRFHSRSNICVWHTCQAHTYGAKCDKCCTLTPTHIHFRKCVPRMLAAVLLLLLCAILHNHTTARRQSVYQEHWPGLNTFKVRRLLMKSKVAFSLHYMYNRIKLRSHTPLRCEEIWFPHLADYC